LFSMCGIIGYFGEREAAQLLISGLKKLEYRGYDSAGIAILTEKISVQKKAGSIDVLENSIDFGKTKANLGIAHTRWATHGSVSDGNAHPHTSCAGDVAVVHNGIIENYSELKEELEKKGHYFSSKTDSEVVAHLVEDFSSLPLKDAAVKAAKMLKGSFALLIIREGERKIIAIRKDSPLIIGVGKNEFFAASDIPAFLEFTNKVVFLDNFQVAEIGHSLRLFDYRTGKEIEKKIEEVKWNIDEAGKSGFKHYMLKEIMEQPESIKRAISQDRKKMEAMAEVINKAFGIFLIGCGTSYHACMGASYIFSKVTKKHINVILASEFPNYEQFLTKDTLMIAVSQSGETADVLEAVRAAKKKGVKVLSIVNVMGSSLMRQSDYNIMLNAGPEICVLATKTYTSQLSILTLLAYACAGRLEEGMDILATASEKIRDILKEDNVRGIKELANRLKKSKDIFIIGRGLSYSSALEAALKLKEVSYIHAEGFAGGELKHGTLALIEEGVPCIALVPNDNTKEDILGNVMEVKARGGLIIGVGSENNKIFDQFLKVPKNGITHPITNIIPLQILAYYLAVFRGCDPDKPRNLAKCVTVK